MRTRLLLAAAFLVSLPLLGRAAPAPAGKSGGPPVVIQLAPVEKLLADVRTIVRTVAGDDIVTMMDDQIKGKLGEKGWTGLDTKKPAFGYLFLPNKPLQKPEDFKELSGVIAIPAISIEGLQEFMGRLFDKDTLLFKAIDGKEGLYTLVDARRNEEAPIPIRARFNDGYVYIGINVKDEAVDVKALVAPADAVKANETAMVLMRFFNDRMPEDAFKPQQLDDAIAQVKNLPGWGELAANILKSYSAMSVRMANQMKETDESGFRLLLDEKASEVVMESYAMPKKGTAYAKELAATKPTVNRFASLMTEKSVAGALLQLPIAAPEMRDIFNLLIEQGQKGKEEAPKFVQPVLDELLKGLGRTVQGESIDFAVSLNGPDKDSHYTAVVALTFDDATGLEKAIKEAVKAEEAPQKLKDALKFDVDKIDGANVHKLTPGGEGNVEPVEAVFGKLEFHLVFGPKGIYLAIGPDAMTALKTAMAAKPAEAKIIDVAVNPKRLADLVTTINPQAGKMAGLMLGSDDKKISAFYVSYEGGTMLKARVGMNLKLIPKAVVGITMLGAASAPPPKN